MRCCSCLLCSVLQVFVNTMYVGELDYNTVELSLPEGQVTRWRLCTEPKPLMRCSFQEGTSLLIHLTSWYGTLMQRMVGMPQPDTISLVKHSMISLPSSSCCAWPLG